jgi:penicillin-binding protein 2
VLDYRASKRRHFYQTKTTERGKFSASAAEHRSYYDKAADDGPARGLSPPPMATAASHGSWAADTATIARPGFAPRPRPSTTCKPTPGGCWAEQRNYVVALEPGTGEILSATYRPPPDPAMLTASTRAAPAKLLQSEDMHPCSNNPALLANPPGSVFKAGERGCGLAAQGLFRLTPRLPATSR